MGSPCSSAAHLADINYRERTCNNLPRNELGSLKARDLAAEGFYNALENDSLKCFKCGLPIHPQQFENIQQIRDYHVSKTPSCSEAQRLRDITGGSCISSGVPAVSDTLNGSLRPSQMSTAGPSSSNRESLSLSSSKTVLNTHGRFVECKGFHSFDSLRYERERLATFIEWPVSWLSPESLAKEGFYYLRDNDYCSCVFCRGIVGAWEPGDIPNREHKRHFPKCPFVKGHPVGNVPLAQGDLLASLPAVGPVSAEGKKGDLNGTHNCDCKRILSPLTGKEKSPLSQSPKHSNPCQNALCSLPEYTGPKRKEFSTFESRVRSFKNWPKGVKQKPMELAQAGFFYCGLSDHVRCYHCGHGLRNWEATDEPWVEHARWYPNCHFVLLSKGVEFIDQVRRENPPYLVSDSLKAGSEGGSGTGLQCASVGTPAPYVSHSYTADVQSNYRVRVTESQLDVLMELDIQRAVLEMGFVRSAVRKALRLKIEETGVPFFNLETCIEKVLACSEEDSSADNEALRQQEAKMTAYQREREDRLQQSHEESLLRQVNASSAGTTSTTVLSATASTSIEPSSGEDVVNTQRLDSLPMSQAPSTSSLPQSSLIPATTPPVTPTIPVPASFSPSTSTVSAAADPISLEMLRQVDRVITQAEATQKRVCRNLSSCSTISVASSKSSVGGAEDGDCIAAMDTSSSSEGEMTLTVEEQLTEAQKKVQSLREQVDRLRELRLCKICMDAELSVVLLPCAHMATCSDCTLALSTCPICRSVIRHVIRPNVVA